MLDGLDFTALRCRVGLVEVLGEGLHHCRAEVPVGEQILDDGTTGATSDREGEEKLDDARATMQDRPAESGVVTSGRVDAALHRQIEKKLDDVGVALLGSRAERGVAISGRVDATLQR